MAMFTTGFAARTRISLRQPVHVVVTVGGEPALWCSGGKAVEAQPTQHNPLCKRCVATLADQDDADADDMMDELGWPWRGALDARRGVKS